MLLQFMKTHLSTGWRKAIKLYLPNPKHRRLQRVIGQLLFSSDLQALAELYGTDKAGGHQYIQHYQASLAPLRREARLFFSRSGLEVTGSPRDRGERRYECGVRIFLTAESTESTSTTRVLTMSRGSKHSAGRRTIRSSSIALSARSVNRMSLLTMEAIYANI